MYKLAVVLLVSIFGSSVAAQSVDQRRLAECVAESQEIINDAVIWKEGHEAAGTTVSAYTYANNDAEGYRETLLKDVQTMLSAGEDQSVISKELEKDYVKMNFRIGLVTDMLNEAFDSTNEFEKMAAFITQCASNYDGEFYSQQDEIEELRRGLDQAVLVNEALIFGHEKDLQRLQVKHKADTRTLLEPYKQRINTLCTLMRDYNHLDVLEKQVFLYGKKYDLCD